MLATLAWLLLALAGPADELEELARQRAWDVLIEAASERLDADAQDDVARYWLGRARLERARVLLGGGDRFSRDLARALLERAEESLAAVEPEAGTPTEDATDWLWRVRFERELAAGEGDTQALAAALERAWEEHGRATPAALRARLADDRTETATWLGRAVEAEPGRPDLLLAWADALSAAGHGPEALAAWRRARAAGGDLDELLAVLVAILPAQSDAATRLAELDTLRARPDAEGHVRLSWHRAYALGQLDRLDAAAEAFAEGRSGVDFDYDRARAAMLRTLDRHAEAAALLTPWIERRRWEAYDDLVGLADELGLARRWDEALDLYEQALSLEDRDERARRNHALTLYRSGRLEAARVAWDDLVEMFPGRADILNDAGLVAWGSGDPERARALLERAAALPASEDARENLAAWILRFEPGERARARELLERVLTVEPDRARSVYLGLLARDGP